MKQDGDCTTTKYMSVDIYDSFIYSSISQGKPNPNLKIDFYLQLPRNNHSGGLVLGTSLKDPKPNMMKMHLPNGFISLKLEGYREEKLRTSLCCRN